MPKYHNEYRGIAGSHSENVEEWTVDLETLPPILNIETNNKVSITYKNEIKIRWSWSKDVGMIYGHGKDSFPAIFDMKGTGTWHPSSNTARPNQIVLKLSVDPNWCTIKGKRLGNSGYPNFFIDHVKPPPVPFTNAEMILDYMDVTNMLFPSKHCFVANDVGSSNFAFPRDAILVGKFRQVTPALKLPAAASEPGANSKGIKDFVNSLLSEPITPLYGDLINAMVSQSDDVGNRVNAILKQYGYPEYSAEEILSPLRLSPEILFSPKRSLGGGLGGTSLLTDHSSSPGAATEEGSNSPMSSKGVNEERFQSYHGLLSTLIEPIDIRLFGGRYTITEPLSDAGAILIIHPGTGKIYHEGIISLPKVTLNKETSDTLVAWSRNGRQFVATFNVSIDETTNLGTVSVHGRMTDVQDEPTAFSAQLDSSRVSNTMRSKRTHSAGMLRSAEAGSDDTLQPEESIEEWAQSDQLGLAIALGVALTTLLFLGAIISKARGSQRGRDVAAAHDALLRQGVAEFKEHLTTKAKEKARNDLIAHEWEVNQLVEQVTGGMRDCVRLLTRFQPYREWVLSHDIDARVEPDSPGGAMLRQVREEMESVLTQRLGPLLEGMLEARSAEYGVSHMLPPEEWRRIKGDVVADLVRNATEALKSDDTDHPSFFEAMTFSLVLDLRAQIYEDHLRDDTTGIERCQARIQNLNSAENTIRTRLANLHEGDNVETLQEELAHMMNEREIEKFHLETFEELRERHEENRNQMESQRREAQKRAEEVKNRAKESFRGK
ncbi:hypothetical protein GQ44DRAFT_778959 [Phaeosphaeriaceae sp. PMI808]|nr:hypothetical protein GQ44DRAFT_778959 [Phaeosphaeriaceae sp. PMI808]